MAKGEQDPDGNQHPYYHVDNNAIRIEDNSVRFNPIWLTGWVVGAIVYLVLVIRYTNPATAKYVAIVIPTGMGGLLGLLHLQTTYPHLSSNLLFAMLVGQCLLVGGIVYFLPISKMVADWLAGVVTVVFLVLIC